MEKDVFVFVVLFNLLKGDLIAQPFEGVVPDFPKSSLHLTPFCWDHPRWFLDTKTNVI